MALAYVAVMDTDPRSVLSGPFSWLELFVEFLHHILGLYPGYKSRHDLYWGALLHHVTGISYDGR